MPEEQKILKDAIESLNFKWEDHYNIQDFSDEINEMKEKIQQNNDYINDCENRIKSIRMLSENRIKTQMRKIRETEESNDQNHNAVSQRESIFREIKVIEYKRLNPDLDVF